MPGQERRPHEAGQGTLTRYVTGTTSRSCWRSWRRATERRQPRKNDDPAIICAEVTMTELLELCPKELTELCRRHCVRTLEVFGSAADGSFDPSRSDLD